MPRHRNRLLIARAFLALALVIAQTSAQAHLYSHESAGGPAAPASVCDDCLGFAPLLAAAGAPTHALLIPRAESEPAVATARVTVPSSRAFHAFRSRAPPTLL
jgi:hypothetical protein